MCDSREPWSPGAVSHRTGHSRDTQVVPDLAWAAAAARASGAAILPAGPTTLQSKGEARRPTEPLGFTAPAAERMPQADPAPSRLGKDHRGQGLTHRHGCFAFRRRLARPLRRSGRGCHRDERRGLVAGRRRQAEARGLPGDVVPRPPE